MVSKTTKENQAPKSNNNYTTLMISKELKTEMDKKRRQLGLVSYSELIRYMLSRTID